MKNSRVNKWREYRLEIDSNENLDFSIINSNSELKNMFQLIGFDYKENFIKSGYKKKLIKLLMQSKKMRWFLKQTFQILILITMIQLLN